MRGKIVFITGGSGFIGANLARRLSVVGAQVHLLVREGSNLWRLPEGVILHRADVTAAPAMEAIIARIKPSVIFHGAVPFGHPSNAATRAEMVAASVMGTACVLEAALTHQVDKVVHLGSSLEYGSRSYPLSESDDLRPGTFRGAAKAGASLWCSQFAKSTGLSVVQLRLFSVYGPWESPSRFIPTVLKSAITGTAMPLKRDSRHDFVFVEDVVDACLLAASKDIPKAEAVNIGSGVAYTNEEVVAITERVTGLRVAFTEGAHRGNPPDTECRIADLSKARDLLGWEPRYSLEQGLAASFKWLQAHLHLYA